MKFAITDSPDPDCIGITEEELDELRSLLEVTPCDVEEVKLDDNGQFELADDDVHVIVDELTMTLEDSAEFTLLRKLTGSSGEAAQRKLMALYRWATTTQHGFAGSEVLAILQGEQ